MNTVIKKLLAVMIILTSNDLASTETRLSSTCTNELKAASDKCYLLKKDKFDFSQLSSECKKMLEEKSFPDSDTTCGNELEAIGHNAVSKATECRNQYMTAACIEEIDALSAKMQTMAKQCKTEINRISEICGNLIDGHECYLEHRSEMESACSGR